MRHLIAVFSKFAITAFLLLTIFQLVPGSSLNTLLLASVIFTVAGYLVGDLLMLARIGNLGATALDFGFALIILFIAGFFTTGITTLFLVAAISASFLIAVSEYFLHFFVQSITGEQRDIYEKPSIIAGRLNTKLQTEIAEEPDVHDLKNEKEKE